jgi:uncharacterized protein DUF6174
MRTFRLSCLVFAGLAACVRSTAPTPPNGPMPALVKNRQKFQVTVGSSYRVSYQNQCFCPAEAAEPVRLTVRAGRVASVERLSDGRPVPSPEWGVYRTVDAVFEEIERGITRGARRVKVDYDDRYGFPRDVTIDYNAAADAWLGFKLGDLEVIR